MKVSYSVDSHHSSASLLLSRIELSDTKFYQTEIRARLETTSHFCEAFVLTLDQCQTTRSTRVSLAQNFERYVTKFAPHEAFKLSARIKLPFDAQVVSMSEPVLPGACQIATGVLWKAIFTDVPDDEP